MLLQDRVARLTWALAGGVSLVALTHGQLAIAQQTAQADQPAAVGQPGLEEIVVTARRKEEKAQTVPITVNTFTTEFLKDEEIGAVHDLTALTPQLDAIGGPGKEGFTFLRGIIGSIQYFNEIPAPFNTYGGFGLYFDLANVQVLKGPQGTLFGQSADAGAILLTPKPTRNDFEGNVRAEVGDYGHRHLEGVLNVPLVDDKLIVRVGGLWNHLNGYVLDIVTGQETGQEEYNIGRITVTARPIEDFQNDFVLNYYTTTSIPEAILGWYINPPGGLGANVGNQYGPLSVPVSYLQPKLGWYATDQGNYRGALYSSEQDYYMIDTARWDITDNITVRNILGAQNYEPGRSLAGGSLGVNFFPLSAATVATMNADPLVPPNVAVVYSDEVQFQGKILDDKLGYTLGTFNDFAGTRQNIYGPTYTPSYSLAGGAVSGSESHGAQRTNALYAQGTYDLGAIEEGLSFTAGARYTWDKEQLFTAAYTGAKVLSTNVFQLAYFKALSHYLGLDYQLSPSTLLYISDSKGYSKGGFNSGNAAFVPGIASFGPESLENIEIGIKSDWSLEDIGKFRTNFSAYYGFYDNVAVLSVTPNVPSPIPGVAPSAGNTTRNAGTAHMEGFEGEITYVPTDDLSITANLGYLHFKYDTWNNIALPAYGTDWSGVNQFYSPKLQYNIRATYKLPVLDWIAPGEDLGTLSFAAVYSWTGHVYGTTYIAQTPLNIAHAYDDTDINLNWHNMMGRPGLDGRIYVTNLTGTLNWVDSGSVYYNGGSVGRVPHPPRMWGVSASQDF